jgi:hypothetical protein
LEELQLESNFWKNYNLVLSSSVQQINSTWTSGMEIRKENACPAEIQKSVPE